MINMFLKKLIAKILNYHSYYIWILYLLGAVILVAEIAAFNISPLNFHHIYGEGAEGKGRDFNAFYFAGYRLRTGNEFYYVRQVNEFLPGEHERRIWRFIYPPLLAYVFVPFSLLSMPVAFIWYTYAVLILFGASIFLITHFLTDKLRARLAIGIMFLLSPIMWMHLAHGQTDILVLFSLVASFYFLTRFRPKLAGFFIGIAVLLKFTPLIFVPYLFLKNKKAFFSSTITIVGVSLLLGVDRLLNFIKGLTIYSGAWVTSSIFSNGLMGVFYNHLTRSVLSFSVSQLVYYIIILISVAFFFLLLYRQIKINRTSSNEFFVLSEFAFLTSLMVLLPSISLIYNGIHLLFLLLIWWYFRECKTFSLRKQLFLDILMFLIFGQPLLTSWFQTTPGSLLFVLRPVYILIFLIISFKEYTKITYEQQSQNRIGKGV